MIRNINQNINWFRGNNGKKIYSCESATDVIIIDYSPTFYFVSTSDHETKHHVQLNAASSRSKLNSWYRNCIAICMEFLSKVRLRLISPTSEILSRLFSFFFFFFLFEKTNRESFFLFTFSFLSFFLSFFFHPQFFHVIATHPPFLAEYVTNWKWTMKEQKLQIQIVMQSLSQ